MRLIIKFIKTILKPIENIFGRFSHWSFYRSEISSIPSIPDSLYAIDNRWKEIEHDNKENPIFILSASWRSGSTLLQRLVMSDKQTLIWGEPYPHCDYVRKLADSLKIFKDKIPPDNFFFDYHKDKSFDSLNKWIACLYPNPLQLKQAHRVFFQHLYAIPAYRNQFIRWGFKEVRLGIEYAYYLKWLFPNSKFLFLYRNPYDSYRSYKNFGKWYDKWPKEFVTTPKKFGIMWNNLVTGFMTEYEQVDGYLIKYEDLVSGNLKVSSLDKYLKMKIDPSILEKKVTGRNNNKLEPLSRIEISVLKKYVQPIAKKLNYSF